MKKIVDCKLNPIQDLSRFAGVPASEKRLYWSASPWSAFRLLVKKQG